MIRKVRVCFRWIQRDTMLVGQTRRCRNVRLLRLVTGSRKLLCQRALLEPGEVVLHIRTGEREQTEQERTLRRAHLQRAEVGEGPRRCRIVLLRMVMSFRTIHPLDAWRLRRGHPT